MFGLMDNPYEFHLYFWPAVLALLALFPKQRKFKVLILVLASIVYWAILQPSVEWAFNHPFNPDDGGPKTFAFLFGWLFGLIFPILPTFGLALLVKKLVSKFRGGPNKALQTDT